MKKNIFRSLLFLFLTTLLVSAAFLNINVSKADTLDNNDSQSFIPFITNNYSRPTPTNSNIYPTIGPSPTASPTTIPTRPGPDPTFTPTATHNPDPTSTPPPLPEGMILVNRHSVELFEQIPDEYLTAARNLRMLFANRSVGVNIDDGLNCLTASSWPQASASCRRDFYEIAGSTWNWKTFSQQDYQNGLVPGRILFEPSPTIYNRSNWSYDLAIGDWEEIIEIFVDNLVPEYVNNKDVLSFQFSYLNIQPGTNIADPETGFFVDLPKDHYPGGRVRWDISDLEVLEAQYPNKIFIYWTTSLARGLGSQEGTDFNNQMRQYAIENNKILFDVADILSHTDLDAPCYDNRDGVEYCMMNGNCENYPDDGLNLPAICQDYTTEIDGGHLGSVSGGKIRVAKAFWVLMAKIAGWDG
jgi:hypothetical protein